MKNFILLASKRIILVLPLITFANNTRCMNGFDQSLNPDHLIENKAQSLLVMLQTVPTDHRVTADLLKNINVMRFFKFMEEYVKIFPAMSGTEFKRMMSELDQYVEQHLPAGQQCYLKEVSEFLQQRYFSDYSVNELFTFSLLIAAIEDLTELNRLISKRAQ